jgi:hypothetical protein
VGVYLKAEFGQQQANSRMTIGVVIIQQMVQQSIEKLEPIATCSNQFECRLILPPPTIRKVHNNLLG